MVPVTTFYLLQQEQVWTRAAPLLANTKCRMCRKDVARDPSEHQERRERKDNESGFPTREITLSSSRNNNDQSKRVDSLSADQRAF